METLINFFENLNSFHKLGWVVICLSLAFIIESIKPLFKGGLEPGNTLEQTSFFLPL